MGVIWVCPRQEHGERQNSVNNLFFLILIKFCIQCQRLFLQGSPFYHKASQQMLICSFPLACTDTESATAQSSGQQVWMSAGKSCQVSALRSAEHGRWKELRGQGKTHLIHIGDKGNCKSLALTELEDKNNCFLSKYFCVQALLPRENIDPFSSQLWQLDGL